MVIYDRTNLPVEGWGSYVKIAVTNAVRMEGPFEVWTAEGVVACNDGWLVLDHHGNPAAVTTEDFERAYRPSGDVYVDGGLRRLVRAVDILNRVRKTTP